VTATENMFMQGRGMKGDTQQHFQEIVVFSEDILHMFACKKNINPAVVFVRRMNANIGMVIAKSRIALSSVDGAI
jgi:hypothetical protein